MTTTTSRKIALGASTAGVLAGVTGLVLLSAPAGAGQAPSLPGTTPEALVASVLTAKPAAFGGTVTATQDLGLPALPGVPQSSDGDTTVRLWSDGTGKGRVSLPSRGSEQTVVEDGKAVWTYDSDKHTARKVNLPAGKLGSRPMFGQEATANPVSMVKPVLDKLRKTSTITVDGTASVAGRDAYELVLTPKPTERTLLRQVRVAVDNQLRMPLRFDVYGYGSTEPVLHVGFAELNVGAQDPALFRFTPPAGTTVRTVDAAEQARKAAHGGPKLATTVLGEGWDSVLRTTLNADLLSGGRNTGSNTDSTDRGGAPGRDGQNPTALLRQLGKPVSGPWGNGYLVHTAVANAIVASDGRVAAGFVPQQVLAEALEKGK